MDLLSILLRCNGFARIQKAVVDQTGSRPPNSDQDPFVGASLALGSALEFLVASLVVSSWSITELIVASCHIKSTFCYTPQSDQEMVCFHCIKKRRRHLKMMIF